jgi:hypothetical protein
MVLNFRVLFIVLFLFSYQVFAQNSVTFQLEDYVILQNGRRLDGTVLRQLGQRDFERIEFLRRGETETFIPGDIQAFGLGTGEVYKSLNINGVESWQFVQILVGGKINLARYKDSFYAGNEEDLKKLQDKPRNQKNTSAPSAYISYNSILSSLMDGNCLRRVNSLIQRTKLREEELLWLFTRYYKCEGSEAVFYIEPQPDFKISPVVKVSGFQTGIKAGDLNGDRKDIISSSLISQGYLGAKVHSFRKFPKISTEVGVAFESSKFTWESQLESSMGTFNAREDISLGFISFPLAINYTVAMNRNVGFFTGGGIGYGFSIAESQFSIQDILYRGYDYLILEEGAFSDVKRGVTFFQGQTGFQFKLKSKKAITLQTKIRYMPSYYTVTVGANRAEYNKIDLGLGLGIHF